MSERADEEYDYGLEPGESFEPDFDDDEPFDPTEPHVMTVLGPVHPGALGFTLVHEHVFNLANPLNATDADLILDDPAMSVADLEIFFAAGGRSIVDMGPADYGRSIEDMIWIAQRSPVNIILTTGHHKDLIAAPFVRDDSADQIAERSIREIVEGIDGTNVRAGVIKAGTSLNEITDVERRVLTAAGIAQKATGAPISTHTEDGTMALEQIEVVTAAGAAPHQIIIGHMDSRLDDVDYLMAVLKTGVYLSFDRFHNLKRAADEERAAGTAAARRSRLSDSATCIRRYLAQVDPHRLRWQARLRAPDRSRATDSDGRRIRCAVGSSDLRRQSGDGSHDPATDQLVEEDRVGPGLATVRAEHRDPGIALQKRFDVEFGPRDSGALNVPMDRSGTGCEND